MDSYLVSTSQAVFGTVKGVVSWGVSKIFGGRSNDPRRESLSEG